LRDLIGYQLYRRKQAETEFSRYALISPSVTSFKDEGVEYQATHEYYLTALGDGYESKPSESQRIQPGPTFNWTVNNSSNQVVKLTHDVQHQIFRVSGFFTLVDIEPNPTTGEVWVLERLSRFVGNAIRVSPSGRVLNPLVPFDAPVDAAIHLDSNSIWVADLEGGLVAKLDSLGGRLASIETFEAPVSVAVDQRDGACWVADVNSQRVGKIDDRGTSLQFSPVVFASPQSLVVNSTDGSVWVADSSRVIKLTETGKLELELLQQFSHAYQISVNPKNGEVWVIDIGRSTVSKFSENGERIFEVGGFSEPEDLDVNLFDDSCIIADTENDRLVKLHTNGTVVSEFPNAGFPRVVGVQYFNTSR
jgi:DNA-binding beta-propeller fold protein YncE